VRGGASFDSDVKDAAADDEMEAAMEEVEDRALGNSGEDVQGEVEVVLVVIL